MRKGVFAETHHSCLETKSLPFFLLGVQLSWKTYMALGHGPSGLRWDKRGRFRTLGQRLLMWQEPLRGLGAWGACTHVCTHTSIRGGVHRSANVRRICHLGHCLLSDGGSGTLGIQRVLKTVPCPPVTLAKIQAVPCGPCWKGHPCSHVFKCASRGRGPLKHWAQLCT